MPGKSNLQLNVAQPVLKLLNGELVGLLWQNLGPKQNHGDCGRANGDDRQEYPNQDSTTSSSSSTSLLNRMRLESLATDISLSDSKILTTFAADVSNSSATTAHFGPCARLTNVSTNF